MERRPPPPFGSRYPCVHGRSSRSFELGEVELRVDASGADIHLRANVTLIGAAHAHGRPPVAA